MKIPGRRAVVPQEAHLFRQRGVVGRQQTGIPQGAQVLGGEKTDRAAIA